MHPDKSPFYYLDNFLAVVNHVRETYDDLLLPEEHKLLSTFLGLSTSAQALYVRMIMRTRSIFLPETLKYVEIPDLDAAILELSEAGFVDKNPAITLEELFEVCSKPQLLNAFKEEGISAKLKKAEMYEYLSVHKQRIEPLSIWLKNENAYCVRLQAQYLDELLRLLFFGNSYQSWSEFIVTDLGHIKYERVVFTKGSRAFRSRRDIDVSQLIGAIYQSVENDSSDLDVYNDRIDECFNGVSEHISLRLHRLRYYLGQLAEKRKDWNLAEKVYVKCIYRGAQHRLVRVYEQQKRWASAFDKAVDLVSRDAFDDEQQATWRAIPRLAKKLNVDAPIKPTLLTPPAEHIQLQALPITNIETEVANRLSNVEKMVFYVENTLFSSLFGLLFWEVIFAPVDGAFFHPFQAGPADLFHPEFQLKRESLIEPVWQKLRHENYKDLIISKWEAKFGITNHFVYWQSFSTDQLRQALDFIPGKDLELIFARMLSDLKNNRSGFPDLIAFNLAHNTYELIEVKGPGDRVQDNQARWFDFFLRNDIPCRLIRASL